MKIIFISLFIGFIFSFILSLLLIPILKKYTYQSISRTINIRHLKKEGTPSMGGLIFILSSTTILLIFYLIGIINLSFNLIIILITFILYAFIGYLDDYLKSKEKNNKGLSIIKKFFMEIIIAIIFFTLFLKNNNSTYISFLSYIIDLKYLYGLFILFLLSGTTNSVNITDGLDGLASGVSIIVLLTYAFIYYKSSYILGYYEISIFLFILSGSLLGFLIFNFYPAKIFMGDLGSLSLGGVIASSAIILKKELSLIIIGFVFIIETLSSLIQIIAIRVFHKKIFLKSPLHHHFEEKGYEETEILKIFYGLSFISSLLYLVIFG